MVSTFIPIQLDRDCAVLADIRGAEDRAFSRQRFGRDDERALPFLQQLLTNVLNILLCFFM